MQAALATGECTVAGPHRGLAGFQPCMLFRQRPGFFRCFAHYRPIPGRYRVPVVRDLGRPGSNCQGSQGPLRRVLRLQAALPPSNRRSACGGPVPAESEGILGRSWKPWN